MESQENTPEERKARKALILDFSDRLGDLIARHEAGESVYVPMADRMEARRAERTEALVREALD